MIYFAWFILGLTGLNFIISLVNLLSRHYLPLTSADQKALVSVLIPARNEERNIRNILSDLAGLSFDHLEILVYDDHSSDDTRSMVQAFHEKDSRIRLFIRDNPA